jgi:predicted GNAT family acetyltransferase
MLVAVATHPDWRGRGLATACLHELLHRLRGRGKVGCLFYDNPRAGRIYQRFGFAPLRGWSYVRF